MLKRTLLALGVPLSMTLAACGGGSSSPPAPTPGPTCQPIVTSQLIFPAPGSTGVPDALAQIVIAVSTPLAPNTYNLQLTAVNGGGSSQTFNALQQISPAQLPAGSATTTIPNPTYEQVSLVNALPAATQIQTAINNPNTNCTAQTVPGTFTTQ